MAERCNKCGRFLGENHTCPTQSWSKGLTKETDIRLKKLGEKGSKTKKQLFKEGKLKVWNKELTAETDERVKLNNERRIQTINSKEWKETIGKEKAEKLSKTRTGKKYPKLSKTKKEQFKEGTTKSIRCEKCGMFISKGHTCPKLPPRLGTSCSEKTKELLRKINLGKKNPEGSETLRRKFKEGKLTAWNKRLTINDPRVRKYAESQKITKNSKEWKETKGEIAREKQSETMKKLYEEGKLIPPNKGKIGELSPSWLGGISFLPYTPDFNKAFKETIRKRDNYVCMLCNIPQEELNHKLHVHHVDYNKLNSFPQNCVSLCRKHHLLTNHNREQWTLYFQSLLSKLYQYEYTQDQKIILDFIKE